jgi:hypothetical protein
LREGCSDSCNAARSYRRSAKALAERRRRQRYTRPAL